MTWVCVTTNWHPGAIDAERTTMMVGVIRGCALLFPVFPDEKLLLRHGRIQARLRGAWSLPATKGDAAKNEQRWRGGGTR